MIQTDEILTYTTPAPSADTGFFDIHGVPIRVGNIVRFLYSDTDDAPRVPTVGEIVPFSPGPVEHGISHADGIVRLPAHYPQRFINEMGVEVLHCESDTPCCDESTGEQGSYPSMQELYERAVSEADGYIPLGRADALLDMAMDGLESALAVLNERVEACRVVTMPLAEFMATVPHDEEVPFPCVAGPDAFYAFEGHYTPLEVEGNLMDWEGVDFREVTVTYCPCRAEKGGYADSQERD